MARIQRRPATEEDIGFLLALRRQTMDEYLVASGVLLSDESQLDRLMYRFECAEVLSRDGDPIGLLKISRTQESWEILQFQLSPQVQGQGIGRCVLEQVIVEAEAARVALGLSVLKVNPAKGLYERLGFSVVSESAQEYQMQHLQCSASASASSLGSTAGAE